jgi:hypothetical protein
LVALQVARQIRRRQVGVGQVGRQPLGAFRSDAGLLERQPRHLVVDEPRGLGVLGQGGAQALHRGVQAVLEVHEGARRPQPFPDLVPRHDVAGTLEQEPEDLERLVLQPHASRGRAQLACVGVEFVGYEPDRSGHGQW